MADMEMDCISDFVIGILRSPTWVAPIAQFVDVNCGMFEDLEENKLEYTMVHNAFKMLIDDLLAAHLMELDVSEDQFVRFCQYGLTGENELYRQIVEQLLSVDDFLIFKSMMVKRNADLQREILESLVPAAAVEPAPAAEAPPAAVEMQVWEKAEKLEAEQHFLEAEIQMATALSLQLEKRLHMMEELNKVLDLICTVYRLQAELSEAVEAAGQQEAASQQETVPATAEPQPALPAVVRLQPLTNAPVPPQMPPVPEPDVAALEQVRQQKRAEALQQRERALAAAAQAAEPAAPAPAAPPPSAPAPAGPPRPTEAERQARAEHLRKQREMLLEKKNQERKNQLSSYEQQHGSTVAAKAAQKVCLQAASMVETPSKGGVQLAAELSGQAATEGTGTLPDQEEKTKQMRMMLTRQLKATLSTPSPGA